MSSITCGFCGKELVAGFSVCQGCGAEAKRGPTSKELQSGIALGMVLGAIVGFNVSFIGFLPGLIGGAIAGPLLMYLLLGRQTRFFRASVVPK